MDNNITLLKQALEMTTEAITKLNKRVGELGDTILELEVSKMFQEKCIQELFELLREVATREVPKELQNKIDSVNYLLSGELEKARQAKDIK